MSPRCSAPLEATDYLVGQPLGTALFLAARMGQPLLLEGEPGVRQDSSRQGPRGRRWIPR